MWALLWLAAATIPMFPPLAWLALLAQASPDTSPWTQLGIGALVAAPAYGAVSVLWQQSRNKDKLLAQKDERIIALQEDRVSRERMLNERVAPQLAQAADLLSRTPPALDRTLHQAARTVSTEQLDDVLQALQEVTRQLQDRRDQ